MRDAALDLNAHHCAFVSPRGAPSVMSRLVQIAGVVVFAAPLHYAMDPNGRWSVHVDATRRNVGAIWRGEAFGR